jgi:hypothetical protein
LQSVEITTAAAGAPSLPMNAAWRTIRSYILWQHERGTLHYDIMVTLILIFLFASPYWINFNDKPVPVNPHPTDVVVTRGPQGALVYEIPASTVSPSGAAPGDKSSINDQLLQVIEPISGKVTIVKYEAVSDATGKVQSYRVWAKRE